MSKTILVLVAAAGLALAGCSSGSGTTSESSAPAMSDSAMTAMVTVADPWIAQPASNTAAMFGTVSNPGSEAVQITGGSAPGVGMVQVHEFVKSGNTEVMQEVPGGLEIAAGGSVDLEPGSYHVMLMEVADQWAVGDEVTITLNLSNGESIDVTAPVKAREGMNQDDATMDMESGDSMDMEASPSAS